MVFTLKFNKLTVKPQTGFEKKAYPERNVAAAILYIFFVGVKNEKRTNLYTEINLLRSKENPCKKSYSNNLLVKEFDHNHETHILNAESSTYVKRST